MLRLFWGAVSRVGQEYSPAEFSEAFQKTRIPALISGCTDIAAWPAGAEFWSPAALEASIGASSRFEVAQSDATVSLGDFTAYMASDAAANDDNPVYIFETLVDGEHDDLVRKFVVPRLFTSLDALTGIHTPGDAKDLLSAAGEEGLAFGLHRWLLMGSKNSGSNMHVDPLGTSAWNTLLVGTKEVLLAQK